MGVHIVLPYGYPYEFEPQLHMSLYFVPRAFSKPQNRHIYEQAGSFETAGSGGSPTASFRLPSPLADIIQCGLTVKG